MKQIIYNAKTGETVIAEAPPTEEVETEQPQPPTEAERLEALEAAMLDLILGGGA